MESYHSLVIHNIITFSSSLCKKKKNEIKLNDTMPLIPIPPPARYKYFISRRGDIGLAIFTGTLAYYFNELENPIVQNDPEKTLMKLTGRKLKRIFSIAEN
ncbi:hypothetical protein Glove_81g40 [Diversispora epigaea]|uniref:Uncharacterized protein n=1 Tax=Diversispora epigaea TaxID=1348612 RepID=A0A397JIN8_9GLOM|nr:hypothetical protein Glove_81g40 [Diversispora epigaea]